MKVCKLISGLLVSLLFSAAVGAADSKYPATDFQPKVLYQDTDYKHIGSSSSSSKSGGDVSVADSNYPAANFEPKVLYQDKEYKNTGTAYSADSSDNDSVQADGNETSLSIVLGLLAVAVVGFILYQKGAQATPARRANAPANSDSSDSSGLSGVARYLATKMGLAPSGVARYLENKDNESSGVAKYMARQKISARLAEAENVSGVEKYLKDRS